MFVFPLWMHFHSQFQTKHPRETCSVFKCQFTQLNEYETVGPICGSRVCAQCVCVCECVCVCACARRCMSVTRLVSWCACCVEHPLTLSCTQRDDSAWNTSLTHRHTHLLLILTVSCTSSLMLVQLNQEVLIQSTLRSGWGCQNVTLHLKWADEAFGITIFNMMRTLVLPRFTNTEHVCTHLYCLDTSSDKCINSYYEKLMN